MSNAKPTAKKVVKISENELVELIDGIVAEAVALKKKEWITEQEANSTNLLERRIKDLESKLIKLTEGK